MNNKISLIIAVFFGLSSVSSNAHAASFDCEKAQTNIEKLICSDQGLSYFDERLNYEYKQNLIEKQGSQEPIATERKWLQEIRGSCKDIQCLLNKYAERIEALSTHTEDETAYADTPIIVGCDVAKGFMLVQAPRQSGMQYYETRGYKMSELEWGDLGLYDDSKLPMTRYRIGSNTRTQSCGSFTVEVRYGYISSNILGYQGAVEYPEITIAFNSKQLVQRLPLGYEFSSKCEGSVPLRILAFPPHDESPPSVYIENTCIDYANNSSRRYVDYKHEN